MEYKEKKDKLVNNNEKRMWGKFYGIGIGPGDPELITLKAKRVLGELDFLFAPSKSQEADSLAYSIVRQFISEKAIVEKMVFPMIYNKNELNEAWSKNTARIVETLREKKKVGFITLGDPMVYSTYSYIFSKIRINYSAIEIETIPGISSLTALSAVAGIPLMEGDETTTIIPAPYSINKFDEILQYSDNIILMKLPKDCSSLLEKIENHHLENHIVYGENCYLPNQIIKYNIKDLEMEKKKKRYLSIMLIKKKNKHLQKV